MTTDTVRLLLCDDTETRLKQWARHVLEGSGGMNDLTVVEVPVQEFASAINVLKRRLRSARTQEVIGDGDVAPESASVPMDEADIVVVDFDLTPSTDPETPLDAETERTLTGEYGDQVAYLLRSFSEARYTIVVNQGFAAPTFDLTHWYFSRSAADLNIVATDLANKGLWSGVTTGQDYRPWHWPRLISEPARFKRLSERLELDKPVLEALGLADADTLSALEAEQVQALGKSDPRDATFRDIAQSAAAMRGLTGEKLAPQRTRDLAVAVTCQWLERTVLAAQNVIVDAPHLATRRPGLVASRDAPWQPLADLSGSIDVRGMLVVDQLERANVPELNDWVSRPVWLWHRVPRVPDKSSEPPPVFCEDVSGFRPIGEATDYKAHVPGRFRERFVLRGQEVRGEDVEYLPSGLLYEDA